MLDQCSVVESALDESVVSRCFVYSSNMFSQLLPRLQCDAMMLKQLPDIFNFFTVMMQQDIDRMSFSKFKAVLRNFEENENILGMRKIMRVLLLMSSTVFGHKSGHKKY